MSVIVFFPKLNVSPLCRVSPAQWPPDRKTACHWRTDRWGLAPAKWTASSSSARRRGATRGSTRCPCRSRTCATAPTSTSRWWVSLRPLWPSGITTGHLGGGGGRRWSCVRPSSGMKVPDYAASHQSLAANNPVPMASSRRSVRTGGSERLADYLQRIISMYG